jgi:hypothetical protein
MPKKDIKKIVAQTAELINSPEPTNDDCGEQFERMKEVLRQMQKTCSGMACRLNIDESAATKPKSAA